MNIALGLRAKVLLTTSLVVGGALLAVLLSLSQAANRASVSAVTEAKARTEANLNSSLSGEERKVGMAVELMASQPGVQSVVMADNVTISDYLQTLKVQSGVTWIILATDTGKILGKTSRAPDPDWPSVVRVLGQNSAWTGVWGGRHPGIRSIRRVDRGGYELARLIVSRSIEDSFLDQLEDSTGVDLDYENGSRSPHFPGRQLEWPISVRTDAGGEMILRASLPTERVLGAFRPIQETLLALFAGSLVFALVAAYAVTRTVTSPLRGVVRAAEALMEGEWPEPSGSQRKDEIGILQRTFDEMTARLKANHERISAMLHVDPLTELLNHRAFRERLEREAEIAGTYGLPLGLALINVDNFDALNRRVGSAEADAVLKQLADLVAAHLPDGAFAGRYAGDEVVVCLSSQILQAWADEIRVQIKNVCGITVSVGCAELNDQISSHHVLVLMANMACKQAKVAGKNRVRYLDHLAEVSDTNDLHEVLARGNYPAVRALAEAVDAKDVYTRGHSQRVAAYARDLARACGFDEGFVELVYLTGTLHDVGKIGVADSVLNKTGKLTQEEYELIMLHPALGEKIVSQIPQLADTLPGIRSHHERFDGRGYPDGLAGESIPILARILAVADTYDAMTSDRPYRKGLSPEIALQEIARSAGTQFDPVLAHAFTAMMSTDFQQAA